MTRLTQAQLRFLKSHQIAATQLFDASSCNGRAEIRSQMDEQDLYFYYGAGQCKNGHSLKAKSGHCIECNTARIEFQLRPMASGYVYLANSISTGLVKVGFTKSHPDLRIAELNRKQYAGADDWKANQYEYFDMDAGRIEFLVHAELGKQKATAHYQKTSSQLVACREVFDCDLRSAKRAFQLVVKRWCATH